MVHRLQNWTHRMRQTIVRVLDQVISDVGRQRLTELIRQNGDAPQRVVATAERINNSLSALANLAYRMPTYSDDWLALFYALWYQPKQINVAYRAIEAMRRVRGLEGGALLACPRLHVIDFGSGSMAMSFATALALADALERGEGIEAVQVDCIDNEQMIWIGALILERFQQIAEQRDELQPLHHALQLVDWNVNDIQQVIQPTGHDEDTEIWFSALHVVYDENLRDPHSIMPSIRAGRELNPMAAFFTSFALKERLVRQAAGPFEGSHYVPVEPVQHALHLGLSGVLTNTTDIRRRIVDTRLRDHLSGRSVNFLTGRRSNVDCEPQPTCYRIYLRQ